MDCQGSSEAAFCGRYSRPHQPYLLDLAGQFHSYYNKHKVVTDDLPLSRARLQLIEALLTVLRNGLAIVGLTAPEKM